MDVAHKEFEDNNEKAISGLLDPLILVTVILYLWVNLKGEVCKNTAFTTLFLSNYWLGP
jgi:hypothetical protein